MRKLKVSVRLYDDRYNTIAREESVERIADHLTWRQRRQLTRQMVILIAKLLANAEIDSMDTTKRE